VPEEFLYTKTAFLERDRGFLHKFFSLQTGTVNIRDTVLTAGLTVIKETFIFFNKKSAFFSY